MAVEKRLMRASLLRWAKVALLVLAGGAGGMGLGPELVPAKQAEADTQIAVLATRLDNLAEKVERLTEKVERCGP